jgi:GNAT superfamily N-acetyltransferase
VTLEIRAATADDADDVADAHVAAWRVAYRGVIQDAYLDSDELMNARLAGWRRRLSEGPPPGADQLNQVIVPVLDDRVVGFGHVGLEDTGDDGEPSERGEIYGFYLHPDVWGTGVADRLIARCHGMLRERVDTAVLWVLRENPRARRFYERNGWRCRDGSDVVETTWAGPTMPGLGPLPEPIVEVQYRLHLR